MAIKSSTSDRVKEFRERQKVKTVRKQTKSKVKQTAMNKMTYLQTVEQFQKDLQDIVEDLENAKKITGYGNNYVYDFEIGSLMTRIDELIKNYSKTPYYMKSRWIIFNMQRNASNRRKAFIFFILCRPFS